MWRKKLQHAEKEIREGNMRQVADIIRFLERDEQRPSSSYVKDCAWRLLKHARLTESQKEQLRNVALVCLRNRIHRGFWDMCRFIRRIANDSFRMKVSRLTNSKDENIRQRALLLQAYLESPEKGGQARREFKSQYLSRKYRFRW